MGDIGEKILLWVFYLTMVVACVGLIITAFMMLPWYMWWLGVFGIAIIAGFTLMFKDMLL